MGRTWLVIVWTLLTTFYFGNMAIAVSFLDSTGKMVHKIAQIWAAGILWISDVRVEVRGKKHLDLENSMIIMANHQSHYDIPVMLAHLPVQFRWLAKAELFSIPIFGYAMRRAGYISIERSDRKSAFRSLARAAEMVRNGASVLIFPEGTRSDDGTIRPFKKGGFVLAVDSQVPVVPAILRGTREIMPKNRVHIRSGYVTLEIRPPVHTRVYSRKTKNDLLQRVREVIVREFYEG